MLILLIEADLSLVLLQSNAVVVQCREIAIDRLGRHADPLSQFGDAHFAFRDQDLDFLLQPIFLTLLAAKHRITSRLTIIPMGLVWRLGVATTATAFQVLKFIMEAEPERRESQHRSPTCAQV